MTALRSVARVWRRKLEMQNSKPVPIQTIQILSANKLPGEDIAIERDTKIVPGKLL
jgi:hypothetical protein